MRTVDDRVAADLVFSSVRLPADALLGAEGGAWPLVEQVVDEATAAVCAEAVGCMRKVLADTVEYTKQRTQFGQPISRCQVLQRARGVSVAKATAPAPPGSSARTRCSCTAAWA